MIASRLLHSCALIALVAPSLTYAQDSGSEGGLDIDIGSEAPPPEQRMDEPEEFMEMGDILVLGERLRSQVDTEQAPTLVLNEEDIAAYGANSIADLVAAIEPQTSSSRGRGGGRPVFLVNGVRIGSFREFRSYPPEAIEKVEVLPEETAQKFGFSADRRVVNFILKDNFSAITVAGEYEQPDRGGYSVTEQEATLLKITKAGRINFNVQASDVSLLTEAERNIDQATTSVLGLATDPDPAGFRSLIADTARFQADANFATAFIDSGTSISLNGTFVRNDSRSLAGIDSVVLTDPNLSSVLRTFNEENPLERRTRTDTFSSSGSMNQPLGDFILTVTADGSVSDSRTEIDRRADTRQLVIDAAAGDLAIDGALPDFADAGFDIANQKTYSASSKATVRGSPFYVPAGDVNATFDLGYDWTRIESNDTRSGTAVQLKRGDLSGGFNIAIPITSTRDDVLAAFGSITLNGQAGFNNYSDFGTLYRWSGGVNWSPADSLDLQATFVWREVPPSLNQLGSPLVTNFNVTTFDLATGDTALVDVTSGGNLALKAETQSDWTFSANWEIIDNARFQASYSRIKSDDVSSSFPFLTPEIEAAFPDRVTRDAAGKLTALDLRPIDYFQTRTERLSFGLNLNGTIGKAPEESGPPPGVGRGRPAGAGGPPAGAATASESGGAEGAGERHGGRGGFGGQMTAEQREQFAAFRSRLCQDDGEDFLTRLAEAVARGETLEELPDLDPAQAQRMLSRFTAEDGTVDKERVAQFRSRVCSIETGSDGPPAQASASGGRPSGAREGGRRGGGSFGGGDGRARYFFNLTHNVELKREILIAPNGPRLDLLDGDSLSTTGTPTHTSRLEAGLFKGGFGTRLSGSYTGSARIDGGGALNGTALSIDDLATFDIRLFADLGTVLKKEEGFLKGLRVAFRVDNVFDRRRIIRDENGDIPLSYQPLLLDPTGRYIGIDLRKQF
ncbi:TonB-dependent receptor plug domain-containing protein [Pontixanthobacter gangjinensis]|uniref:TonB-dependent receptor plug domain-containing protein n=1 Tax=Pontixanthobacter gangjinensis TaxID=1028742 RepID=A0A6I4SNI3_9SPHN|nr:TonB-dependent receptor plug domain-containing protein [Pontixanthobacter gangjinensis]MXO57481.1 TonB-dependent receptor plug domain-containing protein [Pontixanthobacter gangjinensis]